MNLVDTELVRRLKHRDQDALRDLLLKYGPKVKAALFSKFGHVLEFSEIDASLNLAAFNAWRFISKYDSSKGSLRAWFLQIAIRVACDILRGEVRNKHRSLLEYDPVDRVQIENAVQEDPNRQQIMSALGRCIATLPPLQKAIIESDLTAGGTANDQRLAWLHQTTPGSIRASRYKARQAVARDLSSHFENEQ